MQAYHGKKDDGDLFGWAEQLGFDFGSEKSVKPDYSEGMTTEEKFEIFHAANPHIFELFVKMVYALKARGRTSHGMQALIEVVRFDYSVRVDRSAGEFKINNNYSPLYSRLIMETYPDLDGFFKLRRRKNEPIPAEEIPGPAY